MQERIVALDGWRGIAILMVLAFHNFGAPLSLTYPHNFLVHLLAFGWCGVDLFFVLSGFLIGGILLDHLDSPSYYRTFYLRRACRILPPYLLVALTIELLVRYLGMPHTPWYTYAFTANFACTFGIIWVGMWHLWSLSAEEQFYLMLPPLLRLKKQAIPVIAGAVLVLSPVIRDFEWHKWGYLGARFLPFGHMDGLFAGVLLAYLMRTAPELVRRIQPHFGWIIAALIGVLLVFAALGWTNRKLPAAVFGCSLLILLFTTLIAATVLAPERWSWLRDPQLVRIGRYSYMIYLLHAPIFWLLAPVSVPLAISASAAISFGVAALSFRFLESPIIALGHTFGYKTRPKIKAFRLVADEVPAPAD